MTNKQREQLSEMYTFLLRKSERYEAKQEAAEDAGNKEKAARYEHKDDVTVAIIEGMDKALQVLGFCRKTDYPVAEDGGTDWFNPSVTIMERG